MNVQEQGSFTFRCPHCGDELEADRSWRGKEAECTACGNKITIPSSAPQRVRLTEPDIIKKKTAPASEPPPREANFLKFLVNAFSGGRYSKSKNSEESKVREDIRQLDSSARRMVRDWQQYRNRIDTDRNTIWNNLKDEYVHQTLKEITKKDFLGIDGVGASTLQKMRDSGLYTGADIIRRPDVLEGLPRISQTAKDGILCMCNMQKQEAEQSFYPVFTDKADSTKEMRLLTFSLALEQVDNYLQRIKTQHAKISPRSRSLPPFKLWEHLFAKPNINISHSTANAYAEIQEAWDAMRTEPVPTLNEGTLSQDEYIRALGLLETIHPRPLNPNLDRSRGTNDGNPALSPLTGFTDAEKEIHKHISEKEKTRTNKSYQKADAFHHAGGNRALALLRYPRDQALVQEIEAYPLDESRMNGIVLRNYQRFAAKFILSQKKVIIGDEMGLGKTIQALTVMSHLSTKSSLEGKPFLGLVVCPASIRVNWEREIKRFTHFNTYSIRGQSGSASISTWMKQGGIVITSYESLKWFPDFKEPLGACIVDEAQYIKNPIAQRSKNCSRIMSQSKVAVSMTGTPIENNLEEFLNIFSATKKDSGRDLKALMLESDEAARFAASIQSLYLRRTKQDVLTELPALNVTVEAVELEESEKIQHMEDIENNNVHFMRLRQNLNDPSLCGKSKLKRVEALLEEYRQNQRNVIIFSYFLEPIAWLQTLISECYIIHGGVTDVGRQKVIDRFSTPLSDNEPGRVMFAQIKSGGVGLNIQAASAVILLEPQFNPAVELQAISRVHRMGQRRSVDVHRMICVDSIEEILLERLYQKQEIMDLYADDSYLKHLSPDAMDKSSKPMSDNEADLRNEVLTRFKKVVAE